MALSNAISADTVVEIQDRGSVDGTPTALSVVTITGIMRRLNVAKRSGKRISVSGFGTTDKFRPGKTMFEINMEMLIPVASRIAFVEGDYISVEHTIGTNAEEKYAGYLESAEDEIVDDSECLVRLVIVGPADGGTTT